MNAFQTGMLRTLGLVYASHGGLRAIVYSGYFRCSVLLAVLCWPSVVSESWNAAAMSVLPTLAGFSIAAYAVIFAVLDQPSRQALSAPEPELGNRSPLLIIVGSVTHAVVMQIITLLYSFCFGQKPIPLIFDFIDVVIVNAFFSAIGLLMFLYSVTLVLASVLTLFRVLEIRARV